MNSGDSVMTIATRSFTKFEIDEEFPANPIREVDFEIRFTPRLRVPPELWRFQEDLEAEYPDVGLETASAPQRSHGQRHGFPKSGEGTRYQGVTAKHGVGVFGIQQLRGVQR